MSKKLNCRPENVACGRKCQPKRFKCPSEKSGEEAGLITQVVSLIMAQPAEESGPPLGSTSNPIDISGFVKIGEQAGSNPGGFYQDADGNEYYLKEPKSKLHAENERLASLLYLETGIDSVEIMIGTDEDGKLFTVSPIRKRDESTDLRKEIKKGGEVIDKIKEGFAVDAWLSNWDVVGDGLNNIIVDEAGSPVRVDPGGSLMWRAQGGPKGDLFDNEVSELDTLRDKKLNRGSAKVFGDMTEAEMIKSAENLYNISEQQIRKMVMAEITDVSARELLMERLLRRREKIIEKFLEASK